MATKKKPRRITQEELARMHYDPVEKVYYDTSELEERGMEVPEWARGGGDKTSKDFSPTHELSESGRIVPIGGEPDSYDPAAARGGGEFYAPPEGEPVWQEKDADGNVTYTEYAPGSEARKVRFESRAELKQELERRRVQGEFPRGRGGLYGLIPYAEYEMGRKVDAANRLSKEEKEKQEQISKRVDELPSRDPETTVSEQKKEEGAGGEPVKDQPEPSDINEPPEGAPDAVEPEPEAVKVPVEPATQAPEDEPVESEVDPDDVITDKPEYTSTDISQLEEALEELGQANPLIQKAPVEDTESGFKVPRVRDPDTLPPTLPEKEEAPDPALADVVAEKEFIDWPAEGEEPNKPVVQDEGPPALPEVDPLDVGDVQMEEKEDQVISAEEIAALAKDKFPDDGMEYLEPIFEASVFKHKYNADDPRDRAQMEFLINFFIREGLPLTPTIEAGLGKKAADEFFGAEEAK